MSSLVSVILALRMVSRAVLMSASISSDGTVSSVDASFIPGGHLVQLNCSFFSPVSAHHVHTGRYCSHCTVASGSAASIGFFC